MRSFWVFFKWSFSLVLFPTFLLAAFFFSQRDQFFSIQKVEVLLSDDLPETSHMTHFLKKIKKQLDVLKGHSLLDLKVSDVYQSLQKESWIESLALTRKWPDQLVVQITARPTKMVYVNQQGQVFPVLDDGSLLEKIDPVTAPNTLIMVGKNFEDSTELRRKAIAVLEEIPDEGSFSKKHIAELGFDRNSGFWVSLMQEGVQVRLGEDRVRLKSQRVSQVIDYIQNQELQARVIDANFSKKVLVKLRKAP